MSEHSIPDYRTTKFTPTPPGTPYDLVKCAWCGIPLDDKNRSKASTWVICRKYLIYQICKPCRRRFYGKLTDAELLKKCHILAKWMDEERK